MALLPRTLLLFDEPFVEVGGVYYCPFVWWRFVNKLAEHCESCTLYVPLKENAPAPTGPAVELKRARLAGRPYYRRLKHYYAQLPLTRARLRRQARNFIGTVIGTAISVPVGIGGPAYRTGNVEGYVETVLQGTYRREVFEKVGLLDESMIRTEDDDLHIRLHQAGGRIYITPKVRSDHHARESLRKVAR